MPSERQFRPVVEPPVAPWWHTAALVAVYVLVATTGVLLTSRGVSPAPPIVASRLARVYAPLVFVEGMLAVYVVRVGRPRSALSELLGRKWNSLRRAGMDVALATAAFFVIRLFDLAWTRAFALGKGAIVNALPVTGFERAAWVVVALVIGVSEELVFRGYLQTQFTALTRRAAFGIAVQAALFGIAHAEQGPEAIVRIAIYGAGLGVLAHFRRSLLPGIVCHVATDLASGLFRH